MVKVNEPVSEADRRLDALRNEIRQRYSAVSGDWGVHMVMVSVENGESTQMIPAYALGYITTDETAGPPPMDDLSARFDNVRPERFKMAWQGWDADMD